VRYALQEAHLQGPLGIRVSRTRVIVEMKRLTSGKFWHGLQTQTLIYMNSQKVRRAIYLAVRDSDTPGMRKRWRAMAGEAALVSDKHSIQVLVEGVDVLPNGSASKAKNK
jgi:hypothetical protein